MFVAEASLAKKAEDVLILELKKANTFTDYFVICSTVSDRRAKTVADNIIESLEDAGQKVYHQEGYKEGLWIILDCADVIVHIFRKDKREFYRLEKLWADVPQKSIA